MPHRRVCGYSLDAAARFAGLGVDTIKEWERLGAPDKAGLSAGERRYSHSSVARLRHLGELRARGHPIQTLLELSAAELGALVMRVDPALPAPATGLRLDLLTTALDDYDLDGIDAVLSQHSALLPPPLLIFAVILPFLREVGRRWEAGTIGPAQEHLVSGVVRGVLGGLLHTARRPDRRPKVVFATPAGERHEFGLLCAAILAAWDGYSVLYLGPDLPARDIAHTARAVNAHVVMISITIPSVVSHRQAKHLAALLRGTQLWMGGPHAQATQSIADGGTRYIDSIEAVSPALASVLT